MTRCYTSWDLTAGDPGRDVAVSTSSAYETLSKRERKIRLLAAVAAHLQTAFADEDEVAECSPRTDPHPAPAIRLVLSAVFPFDKEFGIAESEPDRCSQGSAKGARGWKLGDTIRSWLSCNEPTHGEP